MQVIYGPGLAGNPLFNSQKRLIRPTLTQGNAFPYPALLDPSMRNSDLSIRVPQAGDTTPLARTADAYTIEGSLIPGLVMVRTTNEYVTVANGANAAVQPFGLLGQFVGGSFDNVGLVNSVGVWMGPDSVYELLAPAWNDSTVASAVAAATPGTEVLLYGGTDGRLTYLSSPGSQIPVARVIDRPSPSRLLIQLVI
jgi:hypothetical protein